MLLHIFNKSGFSYAIYLSIQFYTDFELIIFVKNFLQLVVETGHSTGDLKQTRLTDFIPERVALIINW